MEDPKVVEALLADLKSHEGFEERIYLDSQGHKTMGIGHLITKDCPEWDLPVGTPVSRERVIEVFHGDIRLAYWTAYSIFDDLAERPMAVQRVILNMAFNLGRSRLLQFKNMIAAYDAHDYERMAAEMKDSLWYKQTGKRARHLVALIKEMA